MKTKALAALCLFVFPLISQAGSKVVHLKVDGAIHPITAEYVVKGIDHATETHAAAVILQLETPGGLMDSMRTIISKILNSSVPVIVYVAPSGSRAASAGFYIIMSSDIAAMAPGTHIGSAHPVFGDSDTPDNENTKTMFKKVTEDSVAYIKTITEKRGRNLAEAEKAVRESISFTENEALKLNLINFIAPDLRDLLKKCDGLQIKRFNGSTQKLSLSEPNIIPFEMTARQRFLSFVADPNIAFFLFSIGMICLVMEIYSPGAIVPAIVAVICFACFFLATQVLPVNTIGVLLVLFAIILFVLELKITSYGTLTIGGILSLVLGATMLFDAPIPEMKVGFSVIVTVVVLVLAVMAFLLTMVLTLHRKKPLTGVQGIMQEIGLAETDIDPEGRVFVHGTLWNATSPHRITKGEKVRIRVIDGLTLHVERI